MPATQWSRDMGLATPIVNAPMGGVAGGRLAAAVTAAGGLGMIGMGSAGSVPALERELGKLGAVAGPFGIGLVAWVLEREPALLELALESRPALLSVGFTEEWSWVERVHAAGVRAATQVYDREQAQRAAEAGVDVLIARGSEGGGHGAPLLGTLPLLDEVLEAVSVPVLAAGGIGTARSLAAVLAAGADGAWLGTCFTACPEALTPEPARAALVRARGTDTVLTRAFDLAHNLPWPEQFPARQLGNEVIRQWAGREAELAHDRPARAEIAAALSADPRGAPVDAGQGVGVLDRSRPAGEIVTELATGADRLLQRWAVGPTDSR